MARLVLICLFAAGCAGSPVAGCDEPGRDCCSTDSDCADWYGPVFPYCLTPGDKTGICAECVTGDDCGVYEVCREDDTIGAYCVDRDAE